MTAAGGDPPARGNGRSDEAIAASAGELADVLEELRDELRGSHRRGPFGLPAPPTPRELLRFTDDYAIPFAIAVLEANIRALRLLQGAIRLVDTGEQAREEVKTTRDRAISFSQSTLSRLDDVLSDLEDAATEDTDDGEFPRNPEARSILTEARDLRRELTDALASSTTSTTGDTRSEDAVTTIPIRDGSRSSRDATERSEDQAVGAAEAPADGEPVSEVDVDVEGELQSIKEQLGKVDRESAAEVDEDDESAVDSADASADEREDGSVGESEDGSVGESEDGSVGESEDGSVDGSGDEDTENR